MNYTKCVTTCIPWSASADAVKDAIVGSGFASETQIAASRSGTGGASSAYGYGWFIEYIGFASVVAPLSAELCGASVYGQPSDLIYFDGNWYTAADSYDP